jgi:hypothetical protein
MIHHRPQGFDDHFVRRGYLIKSSAVGSSTVLGPSLLPSDVGNAGGRENRFIDRAGTPRQNEEVAPSAPQLAPGAAK